MVGTAASEKASRSESSEASAERPATGTFSAGSGVDEEESP